MDLDAETKEINSEYMYNLKLQAQIINEKKDANMKSLHLIAKYGFYDICKNYIIGNNINILTTYTNKMPLHYAVEYNQIKIAELLLANDCVVNCIDIDGLSPFDYAVRNRNQDMINLLLACNSNVCSFDYAVHYKYYEIIKEIFKSHTTPYIQLEQGLRVAYNNNDVEAINIISNYIEEECMLTHLFY
jgi:ankyrin repeat protein